MMHFLLADDTAACTGRKSAGSQDPRETTCALCKRTGRFTLSNKVEIARDRYRMLVDKDLRPRRDVTPDEAMRAWKAFEKARQAVLSFNKRIAAGG